jgi:hypothetical protein
LVKKSFAQLTSENITEVMKNPNHEMHKVIQDVLGRPYEKIKSDMKNDVGLFATAVKPKPWSADAHTNGSLTSAYDYVTEELCKEQPQSGKLSEFYDKYKNLRSIEEKNKKEFLTKYAFPMPLVKMIKSTKLDIKFSECRCADAEYKNFYRQVKNGVEIGAKKEINPGEIHKWLMDADEKKLEEYKKWRMVERVCMCKPKYKNDTIESFYMYFTNFCPEQIIHHFKSGKCSKCGLTQQMIDAGDKAYFDKYSRKYAAIRAQEREFTVQQLKKLQEVPRPHKIKEYPAWKVNNTKLNDLIKVLGLSYNDVHLLGLYEQQELSKIESGKIIIEVTAEEAAKRNNNLYDYYLYIIRNYYTLKNSEFSTNLPDYMVDFLDKYSNKDLSKKMLMINRDFIENYVFQKQHLTPEQMSNFLLVHIADTLFQIMKMFADAKLKEMGEAFAKLMYKNILKFEKKLTLFTARYTKIINPLDDQAEIDINNMDEGKTDDYDDYVPDNGNLDINEIQEKISTELEEEVDDPFTLEEVDVELDAEENIYQDLD